MNEKKQLWKQLEFTCPKEAADALSDLLSDLDAISVSIEGVNTGEILFEPHPGSTPLWDLNNIIALFPIDTDCEQILERIRQAFDPSLIRQAHITTLEEKNWEQRWMEDYRPIQISEKLWICPSWHETPDKDALTIFLDPGMAFGTGTHPTTAMCLRWLEETITPNTTLIDFGCGSGILAICAIKLGCRQAFALDIDPKALDVTRENAVKNGVSSEQLITLLAPHESPPQADFVIANILADPLIELAPVITGLVTPHGKIALSGLLSEQANAVSHAYENRFSMNRFDEIDNWVCLAGKNEKSLFPPRKKHPTLKFG